MIASESEGEASYYEKSIEHENESKDLSASLGVSPIKLHALSSSEKVPTGKRKMEKVVALIKQKWLET